MLDQAWPEDNSKKGAAAGAAGGGVSTGRRGWGAPRSGVPAVKAVRSAGIGHQASARASWLIDPAPRLVGVATGSAPSGRASRPAGASVTSTQSSMPGGDDQSRSSVASRAGLAAGRTPWRAASSGAAKSSKITMVASG